MIPYEVDPSLHNARPQEPVLDDGFSRPEQGAEHTAAQSAPRIAPEPALPEKSDF